MYDYFLPSFELLWMYKSIQYEAKKSQNDDSLGKIPKDIGFWIKFNRLSGGYLRFFFLVFHSQNFDLLKHKFVLV